MSLIVFPASRMNFISLTEPTAAPGGSAEQYGVAVPVEDLPVEIVNNMPRAVENTARGRWGLFSLRSNRRPRLYGMDADNGDLAALWAFANQTMTNIEMLLRDQPATLACTLFEKTNPGSYDPFGVALAAIRIDANSVPRPSWEELVEGKFPI